MFHAGGRTERRADMTKLIVAFRNLANPPKKNNAMSKKENFLQTGYFT